MGVWERLLLNTTSCLACFFSMDFSEACQPSLLLEPMRLLGSEAPWVPLQYPLNTNKPLFV